MRLFAIPLIFVGLLGHAVAQTSERDVRAEPRFEAVSIKRNAVSTRLYGNSSRADRPNGGLTLTNWLVSTVIAEAYSSPLPKIIVGLPEWAKTIRYDIRATSSLSHATADDRHAMLRTMLAERFQLAAHIERRERPVLELVLARRDGRLGSGLKPVDLDCARLAAERATEAAPNSGTPPAAAPPSPRRTDFTIAPPDCTFRTLTPFLRDRSGDKAGNMGDLLEGTGTLESLAGFLRFVTGRVVIDKTALPGTYAVKLNFDMKSARSASDSGSTSETVPSFFTALREELGLKLQSSRLEQETLIIDRLERPTED